MSNEKDKEASSDLYMPSGLKLRKEYFQGFGKKELVATIFTGLILVIIDCILFLAGIRNVGVFFFVPVIGVSVVVMMQVKGELNLSPIDIINLEIIFMNEQKKYPYVAKNEWENVE